MLLTIAAQRRAAAFLKDFARPLERAMYELHIDLAGREGVHEAISPYQNDDGGFGRGVEPDLALAGSSAVCTVRAMELLAEVATPADHPLVTGGIRYLLNTFDSAAWVWPIVPPAVNDAPHAPWWHYDADGVKQAANWGGYLVNPRAEVVSVLHCFAAAVPAAFLRQVSDSLLAHLASHEPTDMHEIACWLRLSETPAVPEPIRRRVIERLSPAITARVERDPAKWHGYCLRPVGYMAAVRCPTSPFAQVLAGDVERCLDFLITQQQPDGSWAPTWSWGKDPSPGWDAARRAWQGILTLATLKVLGAFGRLTRT